jgi:alkylated DNA repair protein alkB family protein 1
MGLDCIFLIGTESTEDVPIALNLKRFFFGDLQCSGDAVVMFGEARRVFHGVPRVEAGTCPDELLRKLDKDMQEFMRNCRINVNVRQVI